LLTISSCSLLCFQHTLQLSIFMQIYNTNTMMVAWPHFFFQASEARGEWGKTSSLSPLHFPLVPFQWKEAQKRRKVSSLICCLTLFFLFTSTFFIKIHLWHINIMTTLLFRVLNNNRGGGKVTVSFCLLFLLGLLLCFQQYF